MRAKVFGIILVSILAIAATLMQGPADANLCSCQFSPVQQTATYSGTGSSCAAAKTAWQTQAYIAAASSCESGDMCFSYYVTTTCFWDPSCGAYRESGYVRYKCVPPGC